MLLEAVLRVMEADEVDTITLDVPLLTRIMEVCREDIKSDAELHEFLERIIAESKKGVMTMENYGNIWDDSSSAD